MISDYADIRDDRFAKLVHGNARLEQLWTGGRWCEGSYSHADYLWSPTGRFAPTNPHVEVAKVKELLAKSL